jgi:hypothetical protein
MERDTEPSDAELPEGSENSVAPAPEGSENSVAPAPEGAADSVAPAPEATGDPRVDAAIADLGDLAGLAVSEHPPVFERIHGELVEVLGELHTGVGLTDPAEPGESADG